MLIPDPSVELAWAAGFFDGEGCTTRTGRPGLSMRPRVTISQIERGNLERFQQAVGGWGAITRHGGRNMLCWQTKNNRETWLVLAALWPFLSEPKRLQAARRLAEWIESKSNEYQRRSAGWLKRSGYEGEARAAHAGHVAGKDDSGRTRCRQCEYNAERRYLARKQAGIT